MAIAVQRSTGLSAERVAAWSRAWRTREIAGEAVLAIASIDDVAIVRGAFQRGEGVARGSGGARVFTSPEMIYVGLVLPRPDALVACDASKLVNRYVRPMLRAMTTLGAPARYFGRDWIDVKSRPVAAVGFAHDGSTGRSLVEAFVGTRAPFTREERASFLGKTPAALGADVDASKLSDAIVRAFASSYARAAVDEGALAGFDATSDARDPEWTAREPEAIGDVCAGRDANGAMRVGGDFMISIDAIERLEARLASGETDVPRAVNESLAGAAVEGV